MKWLVSISIAIAIVMGCATTNKDVLPPDQDNLPPAFDVQTPQDRQALDYFLLKMADSAQKPNMRWWANYRRAALWTDQDPSVACQKFAALAVDEKFPAHEVALVRARGVCTEAQAEVLHLPILDLANVEPWLKGVALNVSLFQARRDGNKAALADLLLEKSKQFMTNEEKTELVKEALALAHELNDTARATTAQERLTKVAPRYLTEPAADDWFAVAGDFRRAREFASARAMYDKILASPRFNTAQKISALRGLSMAYKNERKKDEYIQTLSRLWKFTETPLLAKGKKRVRKNLPVAVLKAYHDAATSYARALWTAGSLPEARTVLETSEVYLTGRYSLDEIYWLYGRMEEEKAQLSLAVEWFKKANLEKHNDPDLAEKIRWYLAWDYRKLKSWPEAVAAFREARDNALTDFSRARFHYWLGRSLIDSGQSEDAKLEFALLREADPIGYYGLLGYRETKTPIGKPGSGAVKTPPAPSRIKEFLDPVLADWLVALEENEVAREVFDRASEALRRQDRRGEETNTWLDLFRYYARSGSFLQLYESLGRLEASHRTRLLDDHPELVFPQPYRDSVEVSAAQFDIPPELIFSIMRQESGFNPRARSAADAFGLMQLLPEVAQAVAPAAKVSYQKAEDLYLPTINIPIGAYHIRQLWDRFGGQFILAVASYNASQEVIRSWMRTRYNGDAVDFIEEIPYEETRGYVRLVMRNLIYYKVMNSPEAIEFPEWVLKLSP